MPGWPVSSTCLLYTSYRHTTGVIYTAVRLAERYGADVDKAETAALFHDACKNLDIEEMNMLVEQYQIGDYYIDKPQLAHSKLAAAILKDKFGVEDEDIPVSYTHLRGPSGRGCGDVPKYAAERAGPGSG